MHSPILERSIHLTRCTVNTPQITVRIIYVYIPACTGLIFTDGVNEAVIRPIGSIIYQTARSTCIGEFCAGLVSAYIEISRQLACASCI